MEFKYYNLPGHEDRQGLHMHTFSGVRYFPCDPREEDVRIEDIAHHLSLQNRFAGATTRAISVAEHSLFCSYLDKQTLGYEPTPQDQLEALMHDAAEYAIQDMIRPMKYLSEMKPVYDELEQRNEAVIAKKFNLRLPWSKHVKRCDEIAVNLEMATLIASPEKGYLHEHIELSADLRLLNVSAKEAERWFLDRFARLNALRATQ